MAHQHELAAAIFPFDSYAHCDWRWTENIITHGVAFSVKRKSVTLAAFQNKCSLALSNKCYCSGLDDCYWGRAVRRKKYIGVTCLQALCLIMDILEHHQSGSCSWKDWMTAIGGQQEVTWLMTSSTPYDVLLSKSMAFLFCHILYLKNCYNVDSLCLENKYASDLEREEKKMDS